MLSGGSGREASFEKGVAVLVRALKTVSMLRGVVACDVGFAAR